MNSFDLLLDRLRQLPAALWNTLTGALLIGSLCACGFFTLVFFNPQSALNPFPPATRTPPSAAPFNVEQAPTLPGAPTLPPAWTPTPLDGPTATLPPTNTSVPAAPLSNTIAPAVSTATPAAAATSAPTAAAPAAPTATPPPAATPTLTARETATPAAPTATPADGSGYPAVTDTRTPSGYP